MAAVISMTACCYWKHVLAGQIVLVVAAVVVSTGDAQCRRPAIRDL